MKIAINPSRYEQVSAATDLILAAICAFAFFELWAASGLKADLWKWVFGLLGVSSVLGAIAHGFAMKQKTNQTIWLPLNLLLGLALGLFVVGALLDVAGEAIALTALPFLIASGCVLFLIAASKPGTFLIFVGYEAIALLFALAVYSYLLFTGKLSGALWMVAGIVLSMVAAAVQASGKPEKSIFWYFDNNGTFHLIQILGIGCLLIGLRWPV